MRRENRGAADPVRHRHGPRGRCTGSTSGVWLPSRERRCGCLDGDPGVNARSISLRMGFITDTDTAPVAEGARADLHRGPVGTMFMY